MNQQLVDKIVSAVLYEGYILYPYRPALKNRQRWTFGGLYPRAFSEAGGGSDAWSMQTQCLLHGDRQAMLEVHVGFLHLMARQIGQAGPGPLQAVASLRVGDTVYHTWQEAVERKVISGDQRLADLLVGPHEMAFQFPAQQDVEAIRSADGQVPGLIRRQQECLDGAVEIYAEPIEDALYRITVEVQNRSSWKNADPADRDAALMRSLVSTHAVLGVCDGEFVSLMDPPERWQGHARQCRNIGTWPVLIGEESRRDTMLSAPITLYDYPQIAPESPGELFDSTEIDELLTLRILTLTEEEKAAMASVDSRTRDLLDRAEGHAREELMGLHGTFRGLRTLKEEPRP